MTKFIDEIKKLILESDLRKIQEKWDSICDEIQTLEAKEATMKMYEVPEELYWKVIELMDDKQMLYNYLVHDGYSIVGSGKFGMWIKKGE